jgi:hypothetical protein
MHTFVSRKGSVYRVCVDVRLSQKCARRDGFLVIRPESVCDDIGATSQIGPVSGLSLRRSFDITMEDFHQTLGSLRFARADFCILAQHVKLVSPSTISTSRPFTAPRQAAICWSTSAHSLSSSIASRMLSELGGERYIKALRLALPQILLIAAGGVNQQTAANYILAGATAIGVGTELIPTEAIERRQAKRIRELALRFSGFVKEARERTEPKKKTVPAGKLVGIEECEKK